MSMDLHPLIDQLAHNLNAVWQEYLTLSPYQMPEDLGYIEGKLEGERLTIENQCYQAPQFRKLHLELAKVGANLDILHCVMYPRDNYPLPIFGADLVGGRGQISAAIVDLSPTLPLDERFVAELEALKQKRESFSQPRDLPQWGNIFSPYCLFVRPQGEAEEALFLELATAYARLNCQISQQFLKDGIHETSDVAAILARQQNYCSQQQQNDKTRRILEKAFGNAWAERYMNTVLFDVV